MGKKKQILAKTEKIMHDYRPKRRAILAVCIFIVGLLYFFKNASFLIRGSSAIALLIGFYIFDHLFDLRFKKKHYVFVMFVAVTSFLLSTFYFIYSSYDKLLHFVHPMMFGSVVFHLIKRLDIKVRWQLVFTFFVVIGGLGLLEIGEYLLDVFFDLKLQGVFLRNLQGLEKFDILLDRIDDTMVDMSLGIIGTVLYIIGLAFFRWKRK